jgi:amino-acid N-acetyltransferase
MNVIVVSQEAAVVKIQTMIDTEMITYRKADDEDLSAIVTLLETAGLPTADITRGVQEFFIAEKDSRLVGNIGLEFYDEIALLRSMVVSDESRNAGIASRLVEQLLAYARKKGARKIYIVTNTAAAYFARKGFTKIERMDVDKELEGSSELNGLCPASSVIMMKSLS